MFTTYNNCYKPTLERRLGAGELPEPGHVVVEDGRLSVSADVMEGVYEDAGQAQLPQVEVLPQDVVELISPEGGGEGGVRLLSVSLVSEIKPCFTTSL